MTQKGELPLDELQSVADGPAGIGIRRTDADSPASFRIPGVIPERIASSMDESEQVPAGSTPAGGPERSTDGTVVDAGRSALMAANFLVAGVSGLIAIWAAGAGRVVLLVVFGTAILVFSGQLAFLKVRAQERRRIAALQTRHRVELEATRRAAAVHAGMDHPGPRHGQQAESELSALRSALLGMCTGYPALYRDRVELTYVVGSEPGQDVVIEERDTEPGPGGMPFFLCRLTAPTDISLGPPILGDLDLVSRTRDDQISVRPFAVSERPGLLRCLYLFAPTMSTRTVWSSRYRMPRLWDDFRTSGHDVLTWTPIPRPDDPNRSVVVRLGVTFEFEAGSGIDAVVYDDRNRPLQRIAAPGGRIRYRWSRQDPAPKTYRCSCAEPRPDPRSVLAFGLRADLGAGLLLVADVLTGDPTDELLALTGAGGAAGVAALILVAAGLPRVGEGVVGVDVVLPVVRPLVHERPRTRSGPRQSGAAPVGVLPPTGAAGPTRASALRPR